MHFRNFLLSSLSVEDFAAFRPGLIDVQLSRGDVLFEPESRIKAIYFPSSACVSIASLMTDGTAVEAATVGCESAVGLMDAITEEPAHMRTFAQVPGSAIKLSAATYRAQMLKSPRLLSLTLKHVRATALQAERGVACNATHDVQSRLARWLLMTQDRTGCAAFSLTQDYMAVMTGVQRSTVSMVAATFKKAKIIDYSRGAMIVLDRPALERHACECYAVIGDAFERLRQAK